MFYLSSDIHICHYLQYFGKFLPFLKKLNIEPTGSINIYKLFEILSKIARLSSKNCEKKSCRFTKNNQEKYCISR